MWLYCVVQSVDTVIWMRHGMLWKWKTLLDLNEQERKRLLQKARYE